MDNDGVHEAKMEYSCWTRVANWSSVKKLSTDIINKSVYALKAEKLTRAHRYAKLSFFFLKKSPKTLLTFVSLDELGGVTFVLYILNNQRSIC